jgi:hypothetical protein
MPIQINNVPRRVVYAPTGTGGEGPYAFTFEILAAGDIAVYKDDVLLTLTTHYTVTIAENGTGSVTITAAGLALSPVSPAQYAIVGNRTIARADRLCDGWRLLCQHPERRARPADHLCPAKCRGFGPFADSSDHRP